MTWSTPKSWTTGEVVTAADLNTELRDNMVDLDDTKLDLAGGTMTGALTLDDDPSSALNPVTLQYLQSFRPVNGFTTGTGTVSSTSFGSASDGALISSNFTVPPSGIVIVHVAARCSVTTGAAYAGFEVNDPSDNSAVVSASDTRALAFHADMNVARAGVSHPVTGLTAGEVYRVIARYRNSTTATSTWKDRLVVVLPIA